jgi:hypothetical protein
MTIEEHDLSSKDLGIVEDLGTSGWVQNPERVSTLENADLREVRSVIDLWSEKVKMTSAEIGTAIERGSKVFNERKIDNLNPEREMAYWISTATVNRRDLEATVWTEGKNRKYEISAEKAREYGRLEDKDEASLDQEMSAWVMTLAKIEAVKPIMTEVYPALEWKAVEETQALMEVMIAELARGKRTKLEEGMQIFLPSLNKRMILTGMTLVTISSMLLTACSGGVSPSATETPGNHAVATETTVSTKPTETSAPTETPVNIMPGGELTPGQETYMNSDEAKELMEGTLANIKHWQETNPPYFAQGINITFRPFYDYLDPSNPDKMIMVVDIADEKHPGQVFTVPINQLRRFLNGEEGALSPAEGSDLTENTDPFWMTKQVSRESAPFRAGIPEGSVLVAIDGGKSFGYVLDGVLVGQLDSNGQWEKISEAMSLARADFDKYGFDSSAYQISEVDGHVVAKDAETGDEVYKDGRWNLRFLVDQLSEGDLAATSFKPINGDLRQPSDEVDNYTGGLVRKHVDEIKELVGWTEGDRLTAISILLEEFPDGRYAWGEVFAKFKGSSDRSGRYLLYETSDGKVTLMPIMDISNMEVLDFYK